MLHNAQLENSGIYSCIAENMAGKRIKQFNIKVRKLPLLANLEVQSDLTLKEQTNVTLNCLESYTNDQIYYQISWYFNGTLIADDKRKKMNDKGQLIMNQIDKSDEGIYVCKLNHTGKGLSFVLLIIKINFDFFNGLKDIQLFIMLVTILG